jgi:hypothetical protein
MNSVPELPVLELNRLWQAVDQVSAAMCLSKRWLNSSAML